MESNRNDLGLEDGSLGLPNEVTSVDSEGSELIVSSSDSDLSDSLFTDFGGSHGSTLLEGSLLLMDRHNSSGVSSLVS